MTVAPMTSEPLNIHRTPMKTLIQNLKAQVQTGLKKSLYINDIWQPLEFKWYLRWKQYVNFDEDGPDLRSDEVIMSINTFSPSMILHNKTSHV